MRTHLKVTKAGAEFLNKLKANSYRVKAHDLNYFIVNRVGWLRSQSNSSIEWFFFFT